MIPRYVKAGAIVPRGDILQSNNNWTPNWTPSLHVEFYPSAGVASRFDYYTGKSVVAMTGSLSDSTISWQAGNLRIGGVLEVHGVDRCSSVKLNNQVLGSGDFQYDQMTQVMTIPLRGATSVQIRIEPATSVRVRQRRPAARTAPSRPTASRRSRATP